MPRNDKLLIVLIGLPGSGKTLLSSWLRRRSSVAVVSRDTIRAAMFEVCQYTNEEKQAAFDAMKSALAVSLGQGRRVCTDGICFSRRKELDEVVAIGVAARAEIFVFHCRCPIEVAQWRVEHDRRINRPGNPSDRNAELVARVAAEFDPVPRVAIELDMTQPIESTGQKLLQHVGI